MSKRIHSIFIVLGLFLLCLFTRYTYISDMDAISNVYVEIQTINSINPRLTSATIIFTINITNPTIKEIYDLSSIFDVFIGKNFIGKGSFSKIRIEPESSVYHKTNLTVYYSGIADATIDMIKNWVDGKETDLVIKGTMNAKTLFGLVDISHEFTAST